MNKSAPLVSVAEELRAVRTGYHEMTPSAGVGVVSQGLKNRFVNEDIAENAVPRTASSRLIASMLPGARSSLDESAPQPRMAATYNVQAIQARYYEKDEAISSAKAAQEAVEAARKTAAAVKVPSRLLANFIRR